MGTSLRTLRRAVGRHLSDLTVLTATAAGSTTKMIDNRRLTAGDDIWRGCDLYFVDGTAANIGEVRRSIASNRSDHSITWSVELDEATAEGDVVEVWNQRSIGWNPLDVNDAINDVITLKTDPTFNVPTFATAAATFDPDSPTVTIPTTLNRIYAVEYQDPDDDAWIAIPRASGPGGYGYHVNLGQGTVTITGADITYRAEDQAVRFRGYGILPALEDDDDETEINNAEWIVYEAVAALLWQGIDRDRNRERLYGPAQAKADALRAFAGYRAMPNVDRVR